MVKWLSPIKSHSIHVEKIAQTDLVTTKRMKDKLTYLQLFERDKKNLPYIREILEQYINEITDRHYDMIETFPQLQEIIQKHSTRERLTQTFIRYFQSLVNEEFDWDFIQSRLKIGEMHSRVQLTPEWFIGSYIRLFEYIVPALVQRHSRHPELLQETLLTFLKLVTLDMQLIVEAYEESNQYHMIENLSNTMELFLHLDRIRPLLQHVQGVLHEAEMIASTAQELSASVDQVANSTVRMAENMENISKEVESGKEIINQSLEGFLKMIEEFEEIQTKIDRVAKEMNQIEDIVTLIREIADQTNLLSLNAAIEAARAGENGRGFGVVADEIRKLAEKTKNSVQQITDMMKRTQNEAYYLNSMSQKLSASMQDRIQQGERSKQLLDEILRDVMKATEESETLAATAEEQSAATTEISSRIAETAQHVQSIEELAHQTGKNIYDVSLSVNQIRKQTIDSIPHINDKQMLRIVITEHLLWKWWLENYALGYHDLNEQEAGNHTLCRFGRWYEQAKQFERFTKNPTFRAIDEPHRRVHELAKQIVQHVQKKEWTMVEQKFAELNALSNQLVNLLNECIEHC